MAQERSPVAIHAFAQGIAAAIIAHYRDVALKGKIYPPCPDKRMHEYVDMARWFPVRVDPFAMLETTILTGMMHEHVLGSPEGLAALNEVDRENLNFYATFRDLRPHMHLSEVLTKLSTTPDVETAEELDDRTAALDKFVRAPPVPPPPSPPPRPPHRPAPEIDPRLLGGRFTSPARPGRVTTPPRRTPSASGSGVNGEGCCGVGDARNEEETDEVVPPPPKRSRKHYTNSGTPPRRNQRRNGNS